MKEGAIDKQLFINNFERKFDSGMPGGFRMKTRFRDHPEWSSLQALVIVVGMEEDYGVSITAEELKNTLTLHDLYVLVNRKIK
jgi:acyl carrier protein